MFRKADGNPGAPIARTACIAVLVLLLAILWAATSAHALSDSEVEVVAEPSSAAVFAEAEEESEEVCIEGDEEDEFPEGEEECEADEEEGSSEGECFLRTARARIVAYPSHGQIRLTLGYTTYAPTRATVEYRVRNGERLGAVNRRLGRSGVLRLSKHLGRGEMARASASHHFTVTLRLPEATPGCQSYEAPAAVSFK